MYVDVVNHDPISGRVLKYACFETEVEAQAHAAQFGGIVSECPQYAFDSWRVVGGDVVQCNPSGWSYDENTQSWSFTEPEA